MSDLDVQAIRHALELARSRGYDEVRLESGGIAFRGRFGEQAPAAARANLEAHETAPILEDSGDRSIDIVAPCVGFYHPAEPPLKAGDHVSHGDVVATISALGLANDLESPITGEIVEVLVEPNAPVQFGQPIARVRASA